MSDLGTLPGGTNSVATGVNERGQSLVDAVYRTLGYHRIGDAGPWYA